MGICFIPENHTLFQPLFNRYFEISIKPVFYILSVNYQSTDLIKNLLANFSTVPQDRIRWVIINNFPSDQTALEALATEQVTLINAGSNLGFGRACNLGLNWIYHHSPQALVWLLNPDTTCNPQIIAKVESFLKDHPEISILGTLIYTTDHTIWFGGGTFNRRKGEIRSENFFATHSQNAYLTCDWVSGCSMIINLKHFSTCPQFDPTYFLYYEDFDFCQRYQKDGHLVAVTNQFSIIHQVSTITNRNLKRKFYHSTYSYLLTLENYSNLTVFYLRCFRLIIYAIILLPLKPTIALGKIGGTWHYLKKRVGLI